MNNNLKSKYKDLYSEIESILSKHDPMGIDFEKNTDEYDPEVGTILPRLKEANNENDVLDIVYHELAKWFGITEVGTKNKTVYRSIAHDIWESWQKFSNKA